MNLQNAIAQFSIVYADQNETDYAKMLAAIKREDCQFQHKYKILGNTKFLKIKYQTLKKEIFLLHIRFICLSLYLEN